MALPISTKNRAKKKHGECSHLHYFLVIAISASIIIPFYALELVSLGEDTRIANFLKASFIIAEGKHSIFKEVDIISTTAVHPVFIGQLNSTDVPYLVSFPWWDGRINKTNFIRKAPIWANPTVMSVQRIIADTGPDDIFVDVGANVGFMCLYALNSKRPVYAIEPISWNIAKIAEGVRANLERGWADLDVVKRSFHLYHAAAGADVISSVDITRPSDHIGRFDAASLSREAISQVDVVTEHVPMLTVDSLIPDGMSVGAVKIDVQGHEYGVLMGMKKLLGRRVGYPKYVFYEDDPKITKLAGYKHGDSQRLLESFGYHCIEASENKECMKQTGV
ncbi:hypothetical protein ACHAWX_003029 [Stephanocyclus meneghinianus]